MARIVFTLDDGTEIEAELDADVITIGRSEESIVVIPSSSVSSRHATVRRRGDSYYVQDLGSTNGTRLNGVEVEEARLEDGDQLTFGQVPGVVHLVEAIPLRPAMPVRPASSVPVAAPPPPLAAGAPFAPKLGSGPRPAPAGGPRAMPAARPIPGGRPAAYSRPVQQYQEASGCAGFMTFVCFLLLAFLVGLHVRHGMETGGVLVVDLVKKLRDGASEKVEKLGAPPSDSSSQAPGTPKPKAATVPSPAPASGGMQGDSGMSGGMSGMSPSMDGK